jgi:hypothetical protein
MKLAFVFLGLAILVLGKGTNAQSGEPSQPKQENNETVSLAQSAQQPKQQQPQEPRLLLPDTPIPTAPSPVDGPSPCPGGVGKPCALLAGRSYFPDRSHMTQHDRTWQDSLKNPVILAGVAANIGAAIWDYRTTRACLDAYKGHEINPLMGQSRAQEVSVSIGLAAILYLDAAMLKKSGHGNFALGVLAVGSLVHIAAATHNHAYCPN